MKTVGIYISNYNLIGGVERFVENFCKRMSKHYDIAFLFDWCEDQNLLIEISDYCDVVKIDKSQLYTFDYFVNSTAWGYSPFDNIKAVFFRDEEVGCDGSYGANMDFFNDCGFVLQCDRQRNSDFVTIAGGVSLSSNEFISDVTPIINKYGYKFSDGMMTDVMALKENGLKCSCANISCGYYNPHMRTEYVNIDDVSNCLDMVEELIIELGGHTYKHKYKRKRHYKKPNHRLFDEWEYYGHKLNSKSLVKKEYCECCGEPSQERLEYIADYSLEMCQTCIRTYIEPQTK